MKRLKIAVAVLSVLVLILSAYILISNNGDDTPPRESTSSDEKNSPQKEKRTVLIFEPTNPEDINITEKNIEAVCAILGTRLDSYGCTDYTIETQSQNRIKVDIPETETENAEELLKSTAKLTFTDYEGNVILEGEDIKSAKGEYAPASDGTKDYIVTLKFTEEGATKFAKETLRISQITPPNNVIMIFLDDTAISSPSVSRQITGEECFIEGDFTSEQVKFLASQINGGRLPFSLELMETSNYIKIRKDE